MENTIPIRRVQSIDKIESSLDKDGETIILHFQLSSNIRNSFFYGIAIHETKRSLRVQKSKGITTNHLREMIDKVISNHKSGIFKKFPEVELVLESDTHDLLFKESITKLKDLGLFN